MPRPVAVVTDSTSADAALVERLGLVVVPLQVVVGTQAYDEGTEISPDAVAQALREKRSVSTSRPAPEAFLRTYARLAKEGAEAIVSIHLSGEVSGTYESAELAAREAQVPVYTVDSRQLGMGTGFAIASAVAALDGGVSAEEAAEVARERASRTRGLFYVDTLEYLRRGGRVGATAALVGSALAVKPLLQVEGGRIVPLEKVRTATKALVRLAELAVAAAAQAGPGVEVDIAVAHLASPEKADLLARQLKEQIPQLAELVVTEVGAVIGAHVGPGMLAVVIAPR